MLGVILLLALDLYVVTRGSAVLDAIMDVNVGVDVLVDVVRQRLIDLLVGVAMATSTA